MMAEDAMETACRSGARAAAQRTRILQAAQKCFVEHGFHAASMATIAQTAAAASAAKPSPEKASRNTIDAVPNISSRRPLPTST